MTTTHALCDASPASPWTVTPEELASSGVRVRLTCLADLAHRNIIRLHASDLQALLDTKLAEARVALLKDFRLKKQEVRRENSLLRRKLRLSRKRVANCQAELRAARKEGKSLRKRLSAFTERHAKQVALLKARIRGIEDELRTLVGPGVVEGDPTIILSDLPGSSTPVPPALETGAAEVGPLVLLDEDPSLDPDPQ